MSIPDAGSLPFAWARKELVFSADVAKGQKGARVALVQELASLAGHSTVIDADFGPATLKVVQRFQAASGLSTTGVVDAVTWDALTLPLRRAMRTPAQLGADVGATAVILGAQHLAEGAREVGAANSGPWVRLYTKGHQGDPWAWCATFVSFLLQHAALLHGVGMPIAGSPSCDTLAQQGRVSGRFLSEKDVAKGGVVPVGSIFLVRRTATDWVHTGFVTSVDPTTFGTLEGNTNDSGSREGVAVLARTRGYAGKDFVLVA